MSVAVKTRLIEVAIKSGTKRKLFLVTQEKADAIETLLQSVPDDELVDMTDVFPDLKDPEKLPSITFRGIRAKTGLTQAEVAERLGITQAEVSKIEGGKRSIGKALAKKIEKEFKIDYRRFL
ncbi:MAG: helix-turn-helix domain-containing protein [Xanthomonadaceae bacterium]|nr:helix-turn-helix domain-containing protein [Xanthomonadaceae bacterium]